MNKTPVEFVEEVIRSSSNPLSQERFFDLQGIFAVVAHRRLIVRFEAAMTFCLAEDKSVLYKFELTEESKDEDGDPVNRKFKKMEDVSIALLHFYQFKLVIDERGDREFRKIDADFPKALSLRHLFPVTIFEENRSEVPDDCPIVALLSEQQVTRIEHIWIFTQIGANGHVFFTKHLLRNNTTTVILPVDLAKDLCERNRFLLTLAFDSPRLKSMKFYSDNSRLKNGTAVLSTLFDLYCGSTAPAGRSKFIYFCPKIKVSLKVHKDKHLEIHNSDIYIFSKDWKRCVKWDNDFEANVLGIGKFTFHTY